MCDQHSIQLVRLQDGNDAYVDPCLAELIQGLNRAGVQTVASCCGHGHRPGTIALADGRELIIAANYSQGRAVDAAFPISAYGERLHQIPTGTVATVMNTSYWWDLAEFDQVVDLAVMELYQDSRDQLLAEEGVGALRTIVADTLRNVHFVEVRLLRDAARALADQLADDADSQWRYENEPTMFSWDDVAAWHKAAMAAYEARGWK